MRKLFALAALCAFPVFAQSDIWKFSRTASLSAASTAITIALPATGINNEVEILDFTVQCSADCSVETYRDGTAPTSTQGSWRPEDFNAAPKSGGTPIQPSATVWYDSNSTGGTRTDEPFIFPANAIVPWGVGQVRMTGNGATTNFTIRIGPMTGTYRIQVRARIRR